MARSRSALEASIPGGPPTPSRGAAADGGCIGWGYPGWPYPETWTGGTGTGEENGFGFGSVPSYSTSPKPIQ